MKYKVEFETDKEIEKCGECYFLDTYNHQCYFDMGNKEHILLAEDWGIKPSWCPLKEVEGQYYDNKIAWSNYLSSYIRVTKYDNNENWNFTMCDIMGNPKHHSMKAGSNYQVFEWKNIKE